MASPPGRCSKTKCLVTSAFIDVTQQFQKNVCHLLGAADVMRCMAGKETADSVMPMRQRRFADAPI